MPPAFAPGFELVLPAPAKLNLFLHVTGRRPDGYHHLQSLFVPVSLEDQLHFRAGQADVVQLEVVDSHTNQPLPQLQTPDNLVLRAAHLLAQQVKEQGRTPEKIHILLKKNIPAGAGLGGGSSDAATTLLALNRLWRTGLSLPALARLGLQLGADVPFFIYGHSAWVEGVGEIVQPVTLPEQGYLILHPDCFISTREIFQHPDLTRDTRKTTFPAYQTNPSAFRNDCEPVVCRLYPQVRAALNSLKAFGAPSLTGTGACVFVAVDAAFLPDIRQLPFRSFVCRSHVRSPVHDLLP